MAEKRDRKTYSEKLRDPQWQRKRLEILSRDGWKCRHCGETTKTLAVHHKWYIHGREPWEYPDGVLVTLCEDCHDQEYHLRKDAEEKLLEVCRIINLWADDVDDFACDLINVETRESFNLVCWAMRDARAQAALADLWKQLHPDQPTMG